MASQNTEVDLDAALQRVVDMAFKANGAGLTLAAVAASNIVQVVSLSGWLATLPAWFFLAGIVFAYIGTAMNGLHDLHFSRLETAAKLKESILDFEARTNPSHTLADIAVSNRSLLKEVESLLEPPERLLVFRKILSFSLNASLVCFVVGVVGGLILIANK